MTLNFYDLPWQLDENACPCDVHFNQYLEETNIQNKSIFHFGTGEHHIVGIANANEGSSNSILGITASKKEYEAYMDLVSSSTELAVSYKVIFADIYSLNADLLPSFDIVTLFHIGEYWIGSGQGMHGDPAPGTPLDDEGLLELFIHRLKPQGKIVLYRNSAGWERVEPIISRIIDRGEIREAGRFKTLRFYERSPKLKFNFFHRNRS